MSVDGARANIDPAERDKFDRLAASWWDPRGDSRPLHELNPARMRFIEERVRLDGANNAQWLLNRLGHSFVFKTADVLLMVVGAILRSGCFDGVATFLAQRARLPQPGRCL